MMPTLDDFEIIHKAFDELDHNHDGMLTLKDFKIAKEKGLIDKKLEEVVL
jgi:Ca2+-binding EF-hand superfamily protein